MSVTPTKIKSPVCSCISDDLSEDTINPPVRALGDLLVN